MREIKYLVIHCTATSPSATVNAIQNYWRNNLKWKSPGYHVIIDAEGKQYRLAEDDKVCNGVAGHNSYSLHVSYIGGIDLRGKPKDTRTAAQKRSIEEVLCHWREKYPSAVIQGHRDFPGVKKACPSFDAKKEYQKM